MLAFNPIVDDSVGGACMRFENSKVGAEQLIPISVKATETVRTQQAYVRSEWPQGSPWLFPGTLGNADGSKPYAHGSLSNQLGNWQKAIDVRDEAGRPVRVHAHQFRHTVGTRLKISDVAPTASFDVVRDQGPIRVLGFPALTRAS